jgi:hypothetical protein
MSVNVIKRPASVRNVCDVAGSRQRRKASTRTSLSGEPGRARVASGAAAIVYQMTATEEAEPLAYAFGVEVLGPDGFGPARGTCSNAVIHNDQTTLSRG